MVNYYVAWWNLENLFDVEDSAQRPEWLQRQLRIGYNSAARLIERMENEGLVGAPNHVGRREVLRDESGNPL